MGDTGLLVVAASLLLYGLVGVGIAAQLVREAYRDLKGYE